MTINPIEALPWNDVVAVGIRTTADGPFAEDLFWQFLLRDRLIELPGTLVTNEVFTALGEHLSGIDWLKIIRANASTEERIFSVWGLESPGRTSADALPARFAALIARLGGSAAASAGVFDRLRAAWDAVERRYHNLGHLVACLHELDGANVESPTAELVELALWYHDAVYEPGVRDCEERSAQLLASDASALGIAADSARRASDLVRATAHQHGGVPAGDRAADLIVDIDLSILGRDALSFMDFEYGVEEEFASTSKLAFRIARGRFLASLLASRSIFRTEQFRARCEDRARGQIGVVLNSPRYRAYRWLRWLPAAIIGKPAATRVASGQRRG